MGVGYTSGLAIAVFLKPLSAEFGWSRGVISAAYFWNMVLAGALSPLFGRLSDRFGARPIVTFGASMVGLGLVLSSQVSAPWHLYLTLGLLVGGFGYGAIAAPLAANVNRWFIRQGGLATGIIYSGVGVGVLLSPIIAERIITLVGWWQAFLTLGAIAWGLMLPAALILRPVPRASLVEGAVLDARNVQGKTSEPPSVWWLRAAMFCCCVCMSIPLVHVVAYAADTGMDRLHAASILSTIGAFAFLGRIGMGFLADRIGGRRTLPICSTLQTSMVATMLVVTNPATLYVAAAVFGIGYGGIIPQYPILCREFYGTQKLGQVFGSVSLFGTVGMGTGGYVGGALFDVTGDYTVPFATAVAFGLANLMFGGYLLVQERRANAAAYATANIKNLL